MSLQSEYNAQKVKRTLIFTVISFATVLFAMTVYRSLLLPIFLAMFFTYVLFPVRGFFEQRTKLPRVWVVTILLAFVLVVLAAAIAGLIPVIRMELMAIAAMFPKTKIYILEHLLPWIKSWGFKFGLDVEQLLQIDQATFDFSSYAGTAADTISNLFNSTYGVLGSILNILLTPLFLFFFLLESTRIGQVLISLIPNDIELPVRKFVREVDRTLKAVLKRQVMVALILAVLYCIGFSIVGLPFSLAVGVVAGLCRVVPYMDAVVGAILSFVIIVTDPSASGWGLPIGVAIVITLVQVVDGMYITPKVIGDRIGLHPALVIASVFAFGDWLGFVGVLIAIPAAAVLKILIEQAVWAYRNSSFYTQGQ